MLFFGGNIGSTRVCVPCRPVLYPTVFETAEPVPFGLRMGVDRFAIDGFELIGRADSLVWTLENHERKAKRNPFRIEKRAKAAKASRKQSAWEAKRSSRNTRRRS